jgi:hypothetical protein
MRRFVALTCALAALALPQGALARVIELGEGATPAAKSNCPADPCAAIGRVTGYQGRAGNLKDPYRIPRAGKIVAFTVTLARVSAQQVSFFNGLYGGPASVRLAVLRVGKTRKTRLDHRLLRQSKTYDVSRYFGSSPTFALDAPLVVRRGYVVALTVPTWAPAFAFSGLSSRNWWRSSRQKGHCREATTRSAQERVGRVVKYGCTYFRARLLYTATYIPDPTPTARTAR